MRTLYTRIFHIITWITITIVAAYVTINIYIVEYADTYIDIFPSEKTQYGMILWASVQDGELSDVLKDRVDRAIQLYKEWRFELFFVTGDDSDKWYKEVESIVLYLQDQGIPESAIVADPHGFDTYDSMRRARYLYDMKQMLIFTQAFHLSRSVYIARRLDIEARGIPTDIHTYYDARRFQLRESAARIKAFIEVELLDAIPASQEKVPLE